MLNIQFWGHVERRSAIFRILALAFGHAQGSKNDKPKKKMEDVKECIVFCLGVN